MKCLSWSDFKDICITKKNLSLQYEDLGTQYHILGPDANSITWEITLNKLADDGSADTDTTDFENNYKSNCNRPLEFRSSDGLPKVASARFVDALSFFADGEHGSLEIAANSTGIIRYPILQVFALAGMDVAWFGANWGDYVDCEAGFYLDENDESTFQSIGKFGNQYKIYKDGFKSFDVVTVKTLPPTIELYGNTFNLFVRMKVVNVGSDASKFIFNVIGWK